MPFASFVSYCTAKLGGFQHHGVVSSWSGHSLACVATLYLAEPLTGLVTKY